MNATATVSEPLRGKDASFSFIIIRDGNATATFDHRYATDEDLFSYKMRKIGPQFEWFPFCPDEDGVFVFEYVGVGEAVPEVVFAVAL